MVHCVERLFKVDQLFDELDPKYGAGSKFFNMQDGKNLDG